MSEMPTDEGPITRFAMVLTGTPKSSQASPRPLRRYKDDLAETVRERVKSRPLFGKQDLYLRIIWFQAMRRSGDVDNIIKPISDALSGVVYPDDKWVAKCASERVELRRDFEISAHTVPDEV